MEDNKRMVDISSRSDQEMLIEGEPKFNYTGLDTTAAYRFEGEPYEDYKTRQKICKYIYKQRLNGVRIHESITSKGEKKGLGNTYIKEKSKYDND